MICSNGTGSHKISPVMIGKVKSPACMQGRTWPIPYFSQKKVWTDKNICWKWFNEVFCPEVKRITDQPVLLLIDNAPGHFNEFEKDGIKVRWFPRAWKQPCDLGMLSALKRKYKYLYLKELVHFYTLNKSIEEQGNGVGVLYGRHASLLDAANLIKDAWDAVDAETIKHCFNKAELGVKQLDVVQQLYNYNGEESKHLRELYREAGVRTIPGEIDDFLHMDDQHHPTLVQVLLEEIDELQREWRHETRETTHASTVATVVKQVDEVHKKIAIKPSSEARNSLKIAPYSSTPTTIVANSSLVPVSHSQPGDMALVQRINSTEVRRKIAIKPSSEASKSLQITPYSSTSTIVTFSPPVSDARQKAMDHLNSLIQKKALLDQMTAETPTTSGPSQKDNNWSGDGRTVKVENLSPMVTNERLKRAFSQFGKVEKAVVVVDGKCQSTSRGLVEFQTLLSAQNAIKQVEDGCFLLTWSPKPITATLLDPEDSICGLSDEKIVKTPKYYQETQVEPRFASLGSFSEECAQTWKLRFKQETMQREQFEENLMESRRIFEQQMEELWSKQQEAMMIKQEVLSHSEEQQRLEEERKREVEARKRMRIEAPNQEDIETPAKKAKMDSCNYTVDSGFSANSTIYRSDGFRYSKRNQNEKKIFLRCYSMKQHKCHATAQIDLDNNRFHLCMRHNHPPMDAKELAKRNFRKELKEAAERSNKSAEAVYKEVARRYDDDDVSDVSLGAMRRAMNYRKSKIHPEEPKCFDDITNAMTENGQLNPDFQGDIRRGEETVAAVFYSKERISQFPDFNTILYKSDIKLKPLLCGEMVVLSARHHDTFSPAIMIWFKYKDDTTSQVDALFFLRLKLSTFRPTLAIGNFSRSIEKAFNNVYPGIQVRTCFYFFDKRLKQKLNDFTLSAYSETNEVFRQVLALLRSVGLLPPPVVGELASKLCEIAVDKGSVRKRGDSRSFLLMVKHEWAQQSSWLEWTGDAYESFKYQRDFEKFWQKRFFCHYNKVWDFVGKCGEILGKMEPFFAALEEDEVVRPFLHLTEESEKGLTPVEILARNIGIELHQHIRQHFDIA